MPHTTNCTSYNIKAQLQNFSIWFTHVSSHSFVTDEISMEGKRNCSQALELNAAEAEVSLKRKFPGQILFNYSNYHHLNLLIMTEVQTTSVCSQRNINKYRFAIQDCHLALTA
jgi:hypothetical protein